MMTIEFSQGVSDECVLWLRKHVGTGTSPNFDDCDWYYERIEKEVVSTDPSMDTNIKYISAITVKDPKKALLFALRWAGQ